MIVIGRFLHFSVSCVTSAPEKDRRLSHESALKFGILLCVYSTQSGNEL